MITVTTETERVIFISNLRTCVSVLIVMYVHCSFESGVLFVQTLFFLLLEYESAFYVSSGDALGQSKNEVI